MTKLARYSGCKWSVCVLLVLLLSCGSRDQYVGTYKAAEQESAKHQEIVLELKANGDGLWRVGSQEVFSEIPIAWYVKRGELRVHTRAGGVIVGKIEKETIQMTLPGFGALTFRKAR